MLEDKFNLHILHKAVVFLNHRQKAIPHSDQQLAQDYIVDQMESLSLCHHQMPVSNTDQHLHRTNIILVWVRIGFGLRFGDLR